MPVSRAAEIAKRSTGKIEPQVNFLRSKGVGSDKRRQTGGQQVGEQGAQKRAGKGEKQTLGKELANHASTRRTQGQTDGHLLFAGGAARQHQACNIGAGDQQDDSDSRHEKKQGFAQMLAETHRNPFCAGTRVIVGSMSVDFHAGLAACIV